MVSYDNGTTWTRLGLAIGTPGAPGKDGDILFREASQDELTVYLVLADGEEITLSKGRLWWYYV